MSRNRHRDHEPTLFDLPIDRPPEVVEPEPPEASVESDRERAPEGRSDESFEPSGPAAPSEPAGSVRIREQPATVSVRLLAGLADLAIHLSLAVALLFGARLLGVRAGFEDWLPITLFLLVFSFFYSVLPLAFWGETPGMAWAGVEARAVDGASLTFRQTALRWLGELLSAAFLGLPTLLAAGGGRSLADRLSDSDCYLVD